MKYGPNTPAVERLLEQVRGMTHDQAKQVESAWIDAQDAVRNAAWDAAQDAAWDAALDAVWDAVWDAALEAVQGAAVALVVRDLISKEHFDVLYGPWASVFGEPK